MTVNAAIPVKVVLSLTNDAPEGVTRHRIRGGQWRDLTTADAWTDLTAAICFHLAPQGGFSVDVQEQAPMGSGLGGSSAYGVTLASAIAKITGKSLVDEHAVNLIQDLEARLFGTLTGCQDHWAAIRGGVQAVHLLPGGNRLERLEVDPDWLESRITVFFTGITHHSGMVNWQVIRRRLEGDSSTTRGLQEIANAAVDCRTALLSSDTAAVGKALNQEWGSRRRLAPEICPAELGRLESETFNAGALAFKACGAGGGGSVLIWHQPGTADSIAEALVRTAPGGTLFPRGVAGVGLRSTMKHRSPEGGNPASVRSSDQKHQ